MSAFLVMKGGTRAGARHPLRADEPNLLGRDWDCRIVLSDPQCSRVHAAIVCADDLWWVEDRHSSNGTFVNGQRIDQAQLADGHELRIGSSVFTFQLQSAKTSAAPAENSSTLQTVVFDQEFHADETGQYTLDFLKGHQWGEDFFFLFQLCVKLLSIDDADSVVQTAVERLLEQSSASVAGFLWLTDRGGLRPKLVLPHNDSSALTLNEALTRRVVQERRAIRIEHSTSQAGAAFADSICVPLVLDNQVAGALHLYRQQGSFRDSVFPLVGAVANIMARALQRVHRLASLQADHDRLQTQVADTRELIGRSPAMEELRARIARVARASGCVLIRGESGTGKELVARALHSNSPRASRPMLSVNCAALPRELMESLLFGHKKGAFTSAERDHIGWFQQADTGTLFLDEIGELTLEGQAKLLRILEGHPFLPVGGTQEITVDVRVICATNRDLRDFVRDKRFREDLYYRLSVYELVVPPLRERGEDIGLLIDHFFEHFRLQHGRPDIQLSDDARARLLGFHWPGNIRQLRNVIDSAIALAEGNFVQPDDLGIRDIGGDEIETLRIDHWERKLIGEALRRTEGNVPKSAGLLGISRATLYRKIEQYGISRRAEAHEQEEAD